MNATTIADLVSKVHPDRLAQRALELVEVPSPTGDTVAIAELYARRLAEIGLDVEIVREFPQAPSVVARLKGQRPGKTLTFNGHLDHVPVPHAPPRLADGILYGRGAADMKGGVAALTEAIHVLAEAGAPFAGEILLIAHGLHEAPIGLGEDLTTLVRRGIHGDAVIIAEGGHHYLPIIQKGCSIFEITIRRDGVVTHELFTPAGTPNPLLLGARVVAALQARADELAKVDLPYVGPESYFFGVFESGDFYNRFPTTCRIVGTRRYAPERDFDEVRREIETIVDGVVAGTGAHADVTVTRVRDGFRIAADDPIVRAVRAAYRDVTGAELPLGGNSLVADGSIFWKEAGISPVYHGPRGEGAHGDHEYVEVAELVRAARVYVNAALRYLGEANGDV